MDFRQPSARHFTVSHKQQLYEAHFPSKLPVFFKVKYHISWSHCAFLNDFAYAKAYYHFGLASDLFFFRCHWEVFNCCAPISFSYKPCGIYFAILHSIALFLLMYMLHYNRTDYILKEKTWCYESLYQEKIIIIKPGRATIPVGERDQGTGIWEKLEQSTWTTKRWQCGLGGGQKARQRLDMEPARVGSGESVTEQDLLGPPE